MSETTDPTIRTAFQNWLDAKAEAKMASTTAAAARKAVKAALEDLQQAMLASEIENVDYEGHSARLTASLVIE